MAFVNDLLVNKPSAERIGKRFQELVAYVQSYDGLEVRCVAVRVDDGWHCFALRAEAAQDIPIEPEIVRLPNVALLRYSFYAAEIQQLDDIRAAMMEWRLVLGVESGFALKDHVRVDRSTSRQNGREEPYWTIGFFEDAPGSELYSLPKGPFLHQPSGLFAIDVPELAAKWLGDETLRHRNHTTKEAALVLPDRRLYFKSITYAERILEAAIDGEPSSEPTYVIARLVDQGGGVWDQAVPVESGMIRLSAVGLRAATMWLMRHGEAMDQFDENEYYTTWYDRVLTHTAPIGEAADDLRLALETGEDVHTEFKSWISPRTRDSKAAELLETVCAFANRQGGRVFIGVDKYSKPVGVGRQLRDAYAPIVRDEEPVQMAEYVRDLQIFISEGVDPPVNIRFDWVALAHAPILRITVPPTPDPPHFVVPTGHVLIRQGGTNRLIRHADVVARRGHPGQGMS